MPRMPLDLDWIGGALTPERLLPTYLRNVPYYYFIYCPKLIISCHFFFQLLSSIDCL